MPNPIISVEFEPPVDGRIECTATYSVQQTGTSTDWGGSDPGTVIRVIKVADSSVLQQSDFVPCSRTRASQTYQATFEILASDGAIIVGLCGTGGATGTAIHYWDADLKVVHIKR